MKKFNPVFLAGAIISMLAIGVTVYLIQPSKPKLTIVAAATIPSTTARNKEKETEEVEARQRQEFLMTQDPALKRVPREKLAIADEWIDNQRRWLQNNPQDINATIAWEERGPNNIAGRIRAVLFDLNDATNNTVLVGSVSGGLWRTTNFLSGSPTWAKISTVSENLAINCIAQDPRVGFRNILYAGTGEGYSNVDAVRGLGIYKSTDGGLTWALLSATTTGGANVTDFTYVQDLLVYSNGDVYASAISAVFCNRGGVLRSTAASGGASWTRVIGEFVAPFTDCGDAIDFAGYDLEMSASGDLYASIQNFGDGAEQGKIYRSPAGGTVGDFGNWTNITPSAGGSYFQRIDIACAPSNNDRVYAIFQGSASSIVSIKRYSVAGNSWTDVNNATLWCDQGSSTSADFSRNQAWYDLILAVQPNDDATVFAGGVDIMKTTNSGSSWAQITQWASGCASLPQIHADIHNIVYLPGSNNSFVVVNDGGIYYTSDNGASYTVKNTGLNITQYYSVALHPTSGSNYMIGGTQDNGSHKFQNTGINTVTTVTGGDGGFCFIDQSDATTQFTSFTGSQYTISRNSGSSFATTAWFSGADRFINPTDYDNTQNLIYAGYAASQYLRITNIVSGSPSASAFTIGGLTNYSTSAVKVDPNTANRVFMSFASSSASSGDAPILVYIDNANASPSITQITLPTGLGNIGGAYISSIDVEEGDANHLLLTVSNYGVTSVWESTNLGAAWTSLDNNGVNLPDMPIRWGIFIPAGTNPGNGINAIGGILLATERGIFSCGATSGTTTTWTANNTAVGNVRTDMIKLRTNDRTVAAATHGRGVFVGQLFLGALPVTYASFTCKAEAKHNQLNWAVENETNSRGYQLERSYNNNINFENVAFIPSATGSSNKYSYTDALVDLGKENAYYRLKQIDKDGRSQYSTIVQLGRKAGKKFVEYVSADKNRLFIRINNGNLLQQIQVRITDMAGKTLRNLNLNYQTQQIDIASLSAGVYVVEITNKAGERFTQQFVK